MGLIQCKEACDAFRCNIDKEDSPECHDRNIGIKNLKCPWYLNVEVDESGCRVFPHLPPPGTHPRLFFTEEEIPLLAARLTSPSIFGKMLRKMLEVSTREFRNWYRRIQTELHESQRNYPCRKTIEAFFTEDPARNDAWLLSFINGFITNDRELMRNAVEAVVFYARVIVQSASIAREKGVREKPFDVWHTNSFTLGCSFRFGGTAYAACYDLMWHQFTSEEVSTVRKAISLATTGRRSWGMGLPARRTQSNWSGYHGDLYAMCAAIEGEDGFDIEVSNLFQDLMLNYVTFSFYDSGHPVEDSYAPNLALREGSMALVAMARRGFNLFRHPNYKKIWSSWMPFALEPQRTGELYGGSSGSTLPYPTSFCVAKYAFPQDPVIDFVYRRYMSEFGHSYSRVNKLQTRCHLALFGLPAADEELQHCEAFAPTSLRLPLTFHCNDRGKAIMRSDWTENAMWFTLDARGDAFLIGHDAPSRGSFVLNVLGRNWCSSPEWNLFKESQDYSVISIDGIGQKPKAPSVKFLDCKEDLSSKSTFASCDLTYAYNWTWTSWSKAGDDKTRQGYEPERNSPRDFGMTAWWLPDKIHGESNVGFEGLHQWRNRFNTVERVTRSALMVREAAIPFLIIADNAKKDDQVREYTWSVATKAEVILLSFDGRDAYLGDTGDSSRRLLVRILSPAGADCVKCTQVNYAKENPKDKPNADGKRNQLHASRIEWKTSATGVQFQFLMVGLRAEGVPIPNTTWLTENMLRVQIAGGGDMPFSENDIKFCPGSAGETVMTVDKTSRSFSSVLGLSIKGSKIACK